MSFLTPRLILIIDRRLYRVATEDSPPLSLVEAAIEGGIEMVQLKFDSGNVSLDDLASNAIAQRLGEMTKNRVPLLVTGDIELADRTRADGLVLIGEKTYRPDDAREYLHGNAIVGSYADSLRAATIAEHGGADFVQVGPVFSPNNPDGLTVLRKIKDAVNIPVIAYGDIESPDQAKILIDHGADGIAVSEIILNAQDPKTAAEELKKRMS
jgi:thiamine-phosphate pyrophosphorylase